ncbi:Y1-Tnp domain-containing protein [Sulfidibacter corallicola]|uniref:Transposase IS200-like domain-containing protein n=1 Tax=Sulfidibacter corallicola TaxID=2818388 RepID=A0A8A4TMM3_SULCO|nr:hypothetical protein [Sulfidibacter corallicola]QTD51229.1 hypothetical protein J3U87_02065 [Sulfidibacter corallicola]
MEKISTKPFYRRHLPHWNPANATYFVTIRLAGSVPKVVLQNYREEMKTQEIPRTERFKRRRTWFRKFESLLHHDPVGPVWLSQPTVAQMVVDCLHYRHGKVYSLDCFCIMPNHLHLIFCPLKSGSGLSSKVSSPSLPGIMHSLKSYTAHQANKILGREGPFWAQESFDHWLRSPAHWRLAVDYVLDNPVKAGFVEAWQQYPWCFTRF